MAVCPTPSIPPNFTAPLAPARSPIRSSAAIATPSSAVSAARRSSALMTSASAESANNGAAPARERRLRFHHLILRRYLKQGRRRLDAADIGQLEYIFAHPRVVVNALNQRLQLRRVPGLRSDLDGPIVADRPRFQRRRQPRTIRVHAFDYLLAERLALRRQFA